jgi:hypothetical protein
VLPDIVLNHYIVEAGKKQIAKVFFFKKKSTFATALAIVG